MTLKEGPHLADSYAVYLSHLSARALGYKGLEYLFFHFSQGGQAMLTLDTSQTHRILNYKLITVDNK